MPELDDFSMKAAIASREAGEAFIAGDPQGQQAYQVLIGRGMNHGEARNEITRAVLAVMWAVGRGYVNPKEANARCLYPALRRLATGEAAVDIFLDAWKGEAL